MNKNKITPMLLAAFTALSASGYVCEADGTQSYKAYYKLDANGDGEVNSIDASVVLTEYAQISTGRTGSLSQTIKYVADYNNDGTLDSVDASGILSTYAYNSTTHDEPTYDMVTFEMKCTTMNDFYTLFANSYEECLSMISEEKKKHPEGCLCEIIYNEILYGGTYDGIIRTIYRE